MAGHDFIQPGPLFEGARIIEAAFYNPDTKMSAVSRMLETAARSLELGHIPGFREVQATILVKMN